MGTRCGQLDPGALLYLMDQGMDSAAIGHMLYHDSGMRGLSGLNLDMRTLLASADPYAAQAVVYWVFRLRRELGLWLP